MDELEFCRVLEIETTTLDLWVEERWIIPENHAAIAFGDVDVARGRLILDLVRNMGVNDAGVDIVVDLVDQLHTLREQMRLVMDAVRLQDFEVQQSLRRALDGM
ncbi:chaperone modulator CbpM [Rhizobium sp. XQZ8]|uniref:chaperone modulator CbpM n=1 Tax=Rhizobium populisoli TaxID=2859785 RepID=UPI001CA57C39|nr:chaperone modulator CbpM [Rhizobium populisoli]MBW6426015.1 chaperone modulator CbpM [Rhizobium populisoli]